MTEKRMLILPAELVKKIDENRGDMSQADFLNYLIDSHFTEEEKVKQPEYATKEEVRSFEQDMKQLLKNFLDFFISYGLEFGKDAAANTELEELTAKLKGLEKDLGSDGEAKKATIKWK